MPSTQIRNKLLGLFTALVVLAVVLLFLPSDAHVREFAAGRLGVIYSPSGVLKTQTGEDAPMMTATYISVIVNILNVIEIILWMALVITLVKTIWFLISKTVARQSSTTGEVSTLLKTVLSVTIYIVAFFIIFQSQFPDVQLAPLFTGSTIIGIVVGLALQDTLGNLFAGLAFQADQPFQVGDVVTIGRLGTGVVESVSWRGVKVRTFHNTVLLISNAVIGKEAIEVAPRNNLNSRVIPFTTVYTASPANVAQRVREAVRTSDNVSQKMRPIVRIRNLGTDGIDWEVKYWLEDYAQYSDSDAQIRQRVWYVCNREKIDFAFPTRTIRIEKQSPAPLPEETSNLIVEHLSRVSIFSPLSEDELIRLASASRSRVYAPGEPIVRIGQEGNSMFVIIRGSVKVQIPDDDSVKTVGTLAENDFFGEMSLLTGEPRSANVVAVVETEVLRIDKNGLGPIFSANTQLVEQIAEMVEERRASLINDSDKPVATDENSPGRGGPLRKIKRFFGLR
jgi:small-conductance mechanosensitive channel